MDTRITLRKLEIFELVVELKNVSQAADRLWLTQPVVTAHIRSLEERIGATLFDREARTMELTEAGQAVHLWAVDVLQRMDEVTRDLDGLADGTAGAVAIAASDTVAGYRLPTALALFRHAFPAVAVIVSDGDLRSICSAVETAAVDLGVVGSFVRPASPSLAGEQIGTEELIPVVAAGASTSAVLSRDPAEQPTWIAVGDGGELSRALADRDLRLAPPALTVPDAEAGRRAVKLDAGAAILPECVVADDLAEGALRRLSFDGFELRLGIHLLTRDGKRLTESAKLLAQNLREHFGDAPVRVGSPA